MRVCDISGKPAVHFIDVDNGVQQFDLCEEKFQEFLAWISKTERDVQQQELLPAPAPKRRRGRPRKSEVAKNGK